MITCVFDRLAKVVSLAADEPAAGPWPVGEENRAAVGIAAAAVRTTPPVSGGVILEQTHSGLVETSQSVGS